ncbi:hypothetical protein O9929_05585 [Vibrio lentus]|nr:hypothetical protein [Vibrio lentus]
MELIIQQSCTASKRLFWLKLKAGLSVAIYCDSKYSIDCITKWATGWEKKAGRSRAAKLKETSSISIKPAYALPELASQITIYHVMLKPCQY